MRFRFSVAQYVGTMTFAFMAIMVVSGCTKKNVATTQIVAKVDGEEISVHQINGVLAKATGIDQGNLSTAKREVLERLIEQQIAINEATSRKLDRAPDVVMAIENAKREIIARSVLDQIASAQPKPTDEEARKYYADHPELFAQRRIFNLQEIALRKPVRDIAEIQGKVAIAKTMEEISIWLKDKNIEFTVNGGNRAAEQIPLEILPKLHQFKDGQMALIEGNDSFFVMRVVASRLVPLDETQALQRIKVFLFNQRGVAAVKREKALLKEKAKVEYLGEFAGGEAAFKARAEAEAKALIDAETQVKAKAAADADALAKIRADEKAAILSEAEAQSKARAEARAKSTKDQKPADPSANVNLEKGIKGLQ